MTKDKWLQLLKEHKAFCYIKPSRGIHDNGWRCFEVGYLTVGNDNKMKDKLIMGKYSDHIAPFDLVEFIEDKPFPINIDLLKDGYIRFHSSRRLWWGSMDFVVSSAYISKLNN